MPALHTQLPTPGSKAAAPSHDGILVTREIQLTFEYVRFDIDELIRIPIINDPWKSCFVPTDAIERDNSKWVQIRSVAGVFIVGKCCNGQFYEVAVCKSYIPWLLDHKFEFQLDLGFDRTEPADAEAQVYGISRARARAQAHFLQNAIEAIWSRRSQELVLYYRRIAPSKLKIPLEWVILNHDVLDSDPQVRKRFAQWLQFISLNLVTDYSTPLILELLGKDEHELLQAFRRDHTDLLKSAPAYPQQTAELHFISLLRCLLVFSGGRDDVRQRKLDSKNSAKTNANLYGSLFSISGSARFGSFGSQAMLDALSESKIFADDDIYTLDIAHLTSRMIALLPIGFPRGYLGLPADVLCELGKAQVDEIRGQIAHVYHMQPTLKTPENNILVFLTWSSMVQGQLPRILTEWAASNDGWRLYHRLTRDLQGTQTTEQAALTLAALLCYKRLLPYSLDDGTQSFKGDYLADFDALMKGEPLTNERTILEHMIFSFLRATNTVKDGHQGMRQLLATVLDKDIPVPEPCDKFLDRYWICRMERQSHGDAFITWKYTKSKLPIQYYYLWNAFSVVVLSLSALRRLDPSLALEILLFSTCGELCTLFIKYIRLPRSIQRSNRRALFAHASLCFSKFILICAFLLVGWKVLIEIGGFPVSSALLVVSSLCAIQTIVHLHSATTKSQKQYSCSRRVLDLEKALDVDTGSRIQNTEKAINLDLGRQYLRKGTSAELCREFDCGSYTTVRLSNLGYRLPQEISEKLDKVGNLNQVPSVLELPDESWEMVVLKSYLLELENKLTYMFPGCDVDLDYDPTEPNREDIECLYITAKNPEPRAKSGEIATFIDVEDLKNFYVAAKARKVDASSRRAMVMVREAWPAAVAYYSCLLERNRIWLKENVS